MTNVTALVDAEVRHMLRSKVYNGQNSNMHIRFPKSASSVLTSTVRTPIPLGRDHDVNNDDVYFGGQIRDLRNFFDDFSFVMRPTPTEHQVDLWAIDQEGKQLQRVHLRVLDMT